MSALFLPSSAVFLPYVTHAGVTFATCNDGLRNSFVLLPRHGNSDDDGSGSISAGQISRIFEHARMDGDTTIVDTYLIVQEYKPLSPVHRHLDPYRRFLDLGAWLCYNDYLDTHRVVNIRDIISHFAAYIYTPLDVGAECIVVRSLDRVRSKLNAASVN